MRFFDGGGACWGYTTCAAAFDDCDGNKGNGCETNLETDPDHCGGCGWECEKWYYGYDPGVETLAFGGGLVDVVARLILLNVLLAVFNMIPVPPRDGGNVLMGLLPEPVAAADDSTLRGTESLSYTLPIVPGSDQIVYTYQLPFTPPTYNFNLKVPFDTDKFRILLADVGLVAELAELEGKASGDHQITIKRAVLLSQSGKADLAKEALQKVPESLEDMRARRLRARLEGKA